MSKKQEHTVEQFAADVEAHLDGQPKYGAAAGAKIDGAKIRGLITGLDDVLQKVAPVLSTLTPAQYRAWVELAAALIHGASNNLRGPDADPAPAPAA
jgi:hypothetical protein